MWDERVRDDISLLDYSSVTSQSVVTSLEPGYSVVPSIVSTDENHVEYIYLCRSLSESDIFSSVSDVTARPRDVRACKNYKSVRKKRKDPNPNEFSLAQKVYLQRKVIAAFGSFDVEVYLIGIDGQHRHTDKRQRVKTKSIFKCSFRPLLLGVS